VSRLAFLHPALLGMGLHVASARARRALFGHLRYPGTAEEILRAGLEACWSGDYLTASPGHYRQFWTRDTGFAAPSLVRLGPPWPDRLFSSLAWAMGVWRDRGSHVTTTVNPLLRWPVDIFDYGVDSLPLLLSSLQALAMSRDAAIAGRTDALVEEHRAWISAEVEHFVAVVVDPATGLVRSDRAFSAHRDTFRNGSTAYANAMVALLGRVVVETGWAPDLLSHHFASPTRPSSPPSAGAFVFPDSATASHAPQAMPVAGIRTNATGSATAGSATAGSATAAARITATRIAEGNAAPVPEKGNMNDRGSNDRRSNDRGAEDARDWGLLLRRHFWMGDRFRDRLGTDATSGEANIWPFHLGLVEDDGDAMLRAALETLQREGFTMPYPLRFEASHRVAGLLFAYRLWSADYQTTTTWTSLGSIYLALLRRVDPVAARVELDRMRSLIERDGTFWEVLDGTGRPWRSKSRLSISDVSMLWGAILLETLEADRSTG
jgi:hypothetical protein